ncbi:hypothetical protein AVEN_7257-1 [Araneus ventricosus]|uniref:Uncharacterized protein n=1 Tax=Araneus ventricosus TaxID=182803 RepID=A0A4Y2S8B3_ARAVE|nr:hypothetical protein AVEN_7257-1 [Araneus ventricosus]
MSIAFLSCGQMAKTTPELVPLSVGRPIFLTTSAEGRLTQSNLMRSNPSFAVESHIHLHITSRVSNPQPSNPEEDTEPFCFISELQN